ncbi:MAG TPA: NADH-quinone oxidoreductase subunit A, partial [Usitatibacter sp.]|nr:NADH-quinone oxidoreductase subunit A [Usitatibacter sp.]
IDCRGLGSVRSCGSDSVVLASFERGWLMPSASPSAGYLTSHAAILAFLVVAVGFLVVNLIVWKILRPSRFSEEKLTTYECGENPTGSAWVQFNIRFYVFALLFIIFDVEAVFLLPWAVVFRELGHAGPLVLVEGLVFIAILAVALAYVWRKGDLEWVRTEDRAL